jgi:hypothetical protein
MPGMTPWSARALLLPPGHWRAINGLELCIRHASPSLLRVAFGVPICPAVAVVVAPPVTSAPRAGR